MCLCIEIYKNQDLQTDFKDMTVEQLMRQTVGALAPLYGREEARAMAEIAFSHYKQWTRTDILSRGDWDVTDLLQDKFAVLTRRLLAGEPLQYILGVADFHGLKLKVTPAVLIPRPETSQLVDMITDRENGRTDLCVLDIGTGSGAIAIALSRSLPFSVVEALDISPDALAIARENAKALKTNVNFRQEDILKDTLRADSYDIIVSNPPYVTESEKSGMEPNVLLHEPSVALFVSDSDPLVFYRRITSLAATALRPGGMLAFEINRQFGRQTAKLLTDAGFENVEVVKDSFGNDRFVFGYRPLTT